MVRASHRQGETLQEAAGETTDFTLSYACPTAAAQLQLDIYGEVLDALFQSRNRRLVFDAADWMLQIELLKHLEKIWKFPDEGIWEVRGPRRHFTHSKVMAWVAFDRGIKSIGRFGFVGPLDHWRRLRQRIHDDVCQNGFDAELGAFTQSYGVQQLDASLLMIALVGFLPPEDKRMRGTVEAIEQRFVRRYDTKPPRMAFRLAKAHFLPAPAGSSIISSFWGGWTMRVNCSSDCSRCAKISAYCPRNMTRRRNVSLAIFRRPFRISP